MEILEILNPWWKERAISKELAPSYRRKIFSAISGLLELRQAVVISGLRRVGKSTIMYQLMDDLISGSKHIRPENILYFSFDEKTDDLLDILKRYSELTKTDWKNEKCFIFLDELQKLDDWSNKLKIIYDGFPNLKIVVSGSSSFQLERDAKANLTGRHFMINVEPLDFVEYLELKNSRIDLDKIELWMDEIKKEFDSYLLKPFPEVIKFEDLSLVKNYIRDNVMEKVLKTDLPKKFKHINEDLLTTLIDIFYENPGTYVNYDEISKELKISKKTLLQHVYYLEFAYLIRRVKNFRPGARTTSRKLQRAYPFHHALRFGWNGKTDSETAVASFLNAKYYWRKDGKKVDFLVIENDRQTIRPVEVKEGVKIGKNELGPLIYFMKKFGINEGTLVYGGEDAELKTDNMTIKKMPLWKLFLNGLPKQS